MAQLTAAVPTLAQRQSARSGRAKQRRKHDPVVVGRQRGVSIENEFQGANPMQLSAATTRRAAI